MGKKLRVVISVRYTVPTLRWDTNLSEGTTLDVYVVPDIPESHDPVTWGKADLYIVGAATLRSKDADGMIEELAEISQILRDEYDVEPKMVVQAKLKLAKVFLEQGVCIEAITNWPISVSTILDLIFSD